MRKVFYPQACITSLVGIIAQKGRFQCELNVERCGLVWIETKSSQKSNLFSQNRLQGRAFMKKLGIKPGMEVFLLTAKACAVSNEWKRIETGRIH